MSQRTAQAAQARSADYDSGLRLYFQRVFATMALGLAITAIVSEYIANTGLMQTLFPIDAKGHPHMSGWWIGAAVLEFVLVFAIASPKDAQKGGISSLLLFFFYAALSGLTLAPVLYVYTTASAAMVFFITAGMFGGAAMYGNATKTDLSRFSGLFMMSLIGLLLAMVVNLFLNSNAIQFALSFMGVFLFVGLTAFDVQRFRVMYDESSGRPPASLVANAALALYLDFLNLFLFLLRLLGKLRN